MCLEEIGVGLPRAVLFASEEVYLARLDIKTVFTTEFTIER